jgi:exodeoxyribonuclease VII small subunit
VSTPKPEPTAAADAPEIDFEKSLAELESIVERLEQGELPLEESLRQFERGIELTRACQGALAKAEQKVAILMRRSGQTDEAAEVVPYPPDSTD